MLDAGRVDAPLEVEKAGRLELGGVGDNLDELVLEVVVLFDRGRGSAPQVGVRARRDDQIERTARMVLIKTELELERQKKVVLVGSWRALTACTPRFIAGCCMRASGSARRSPRVKICKTYDRKSLESSLELLPGEPELVELNEVRCADGRDAWSASRPSSRSRRDTATHTLSVHCAVVLAARSDLRSAGARTSKTYRSVSWSEEYAFSARGQ